MQKFNEAIGKIYTFVKTWSKIIIIGAIAIFALIFLHKLGFRWAMAAKFLRNFTKPSTAPEKATVISETNDAKTVDPNKMQYKSNAEKTLSNIDSLLKEIEG